MDRIGRYVVLRELGQGGMGRVFQGRDPELERSVALKLLHRENAAHRDARVLFRDEARALAALSHPGIVTIFEIGEHDGQQFIAMEYLPGRSLRQLLQHAELRPPRDELIAICAKVAVAVAAAHAAGILHRDIKPENVVVGDHGAVKVVDFGIARRLDDNAPVASEGTASHHRATALVDAFTRTVQLMPGGNDTVVTEGTQTIFGTPAYMAREVLMGDPSSQASDVYSLGVMLYECLRGRRPYEAPNLHEVLARVIDGSEPVPALDDPLWPLVERMLAHDPSARPSLAEIAKRLERRATIPADARTRSRAPWLVTAAVAVVAVAAIVGGVLWQRAASGPAPSATQAAIVNVAVQDLGVTFSSWGSTPPSGQALGDVVAMLLADVDGIRPIGPVQLREESGPQAWEDTARRLRAHHLVRGSIQEASGAVEARLEIVELSTGRVTPIRASVASVAEMPRLLTDASELVAARLQPGARVDRTPDRARARSFYNVGFRAFQTRDWVGARPYLEQAVEIDPMFFDAWHAVASVRGWTMAPQPLLEAAVEHARALAPPGPEQQIWQGAAHYFRGDFGKAIAAMSPLEASGKLAGGDLRELLYYLGESHWHDGNHDLAVGLFRRILDGEVRLKHAAIHAGEYALARRDIASAEMMVTVQEHNRGPVEFAAGAYEALATSDRFPQNLHAQLVLGRPSPELERRVTGNEKAVYQLSRATETGDLARARREFKELWAGVTATPPTEGSVYQLEPLGELLISAELAPETQLLLARHLEATGARAVRQYHRFSILAAPMLGTPKTFDRTGMTGRNARLATAIEAELAGDRVLAAKLLTELVRDPTATWDFPERLALMRNLRTLGRTRELKVLCEDTLRPAVFRPAFLPARRACRRLSK